MTINANEASRPTPHTDNGMRPNARPREQKPAPRPPEMAQRRIIGSFITTPIPGGLGRHQMALSILQEAQGLGGDSSGLNHPVYRQRYGGPVLAELRGQEGLILIEEMNVH